MKGDELWTKYWQSGPLHACTIGFPEAAKLHIAQQWRELFCSLSSNSHILDIATGNGAVLAYAREASSKERSFDVIGIDKAKINPEAAVKLTETRWCKLKFRSGVDAAELPFDDKKFDLVCSQFGIEYADFSAALKEACRVGRARLAFLIHAMEGIIVRQNVVQADQADWLRQELGLFDALRSHVQGPTWETSAKLKAIARAILSRISELENPTFLHSISHDSGRFLNIASHYSLDKLCAMINDMEQRLVEHSDRMRALGSAARSKRDMERAIKLCQEHGYAHAQIHACQADGHDDLIGWWLIA